MYITFLTQHSGDGTP